MNINYLKSTLYAAFIRTRNMDNVPRIINSRAKTKQIVYTTNTASLKVLPARTADSGKRDALRSTKTAIPIYCTKRIFKLVVCLVWLLETTQIGSNAVEEISKNNDYPELSH